MESIMKMVNWSALRGIWESAKTKVRSVGLSDRVQIGLLLVAVCGLIFQRMQIIELRKEQQEHKKSRESDLLPRPMVISPLDQIRVGEASTLIEDAALTIKNVGRGTCYDLSVEIEYCFAGLDRGGP